MVLSLVLQWVRLMRTMVRGVTRDPEFRALAVAVLSLVVIGTAFYAVNQGWSVIDSLYFSIITLTTIGYGDLSPTGDVARLFTIAFALSGIGLFVTFMAEVSRRALEEKAARHKRHGHRDQSAGEATPEG